MMASTNGARSGSLPSGRSCLKAVLGPIRLGIGTDGLPGPGADLLRRALSRRMGFCRTSPRAESAAIRVWHDRRGERGGRRCGLPSVRLNTPPGVSVIRSYPCAASNHPKRAIIALGISTRAAADTGLTHGEHETAAGASKSSSSAVKPSPPKRPRPPEPQDPAGEDAAIARSLSTAALPSPTPVRPASSDAPADN